MVRILRQVSPAFRLVSGRIVARAFAGIAVMLVALGGAANADASHLYWGNSEFNATTIGRANVVGNKVQQNFIAAGTGPYFIAVSPSYIYWGTSTSIGRANINGTDPNPNFIPDVGAIGVAVNSSYIYWTDINSGTEIGRANIDGSGVDPAFITGIQADGAVAVNSQYIYWANNGNQGSSRSIGRANLDGSAPDQTFVPDGADYPYGITVDAGHIYWLNEDASTGEVNIARANLDGSGVNDAFITGLGNPTDVAVDDSAIYWADASTDDIGRANLDGTDANPAFITGASGISGLTVDGCTSQSTTLGVITSALPSGQTGTSYTAALSACNANPPMSWSRASGTLPPGLKLSAKGTISGTPTSAGTYNFTVKVLGAKPVSGPRPSATQPLSITIIAAAELSPGLREQSSRRRITP